MKRSNLMKYGSIAIVCALHSIIACNQFDQKHTTSFISGRFERSVNTEFSRGHIELIISPNAGNVYTIEKRSRIVNLRNRRDSVTKNDTSVWTAIYNPKDQVLYEQKSGKIISFDPLKNRLLVGGMEYKKVTK